MTKQPHGVSWAPSLTYPSSAPRLSEVVHPLRDLTQINQEFLWADQHIEALRQAEELVSQAPCLRYFDVRAPVVLQVDASEYGLGAALLQPATYPSNSADISSSSISPTEQQYAQIVKETLQFPQHHRMTPVYLLYLQLPLVRLQWFHLSQVLKFLHHLVPSLRCLHLSRQSSAIQSTNSSSTSNSQCSGRVIGRPAHYSDLTLTPRIHFPI